MQKVDKLGRIVIPQELRKKYGLIEGASIDFIDEGEGITVKLSDTHCRLCKKIIREKATVPLCNACIKKIVRDYEKNKNDQ